MENLSIILDQLCFASEWIHVETILKAYPTYSINDGLKYACLGANMQVARELVARGANNYNIALGALCFGYGISDRRSMFDWLISIGATDYNYALDNAAQGDNIIIACWCIDRGANHFESPIAGACFRGNVTMLRFLIRSSRIRNPNERINWIEIANIARTNKSNQCLSEISAVIIEINHPIIDISASDDAKITRAVNIVINNIRECSGMCLFSSAIITEYAISIGINAQIIEGFIIVSSGWEPVMQPYCRHYWVRLQNGRIIDPRSSISGFPDNFLLSTIAPIGERFNPQNNDIAMEKCYKSMLSPSTFNVKKYICEAPHAIRHIYDGILREIMNQ